jgi:hypothetical protein
MYGLVNKAVQDLVCSKFGEQTWEQIKERAGVEDEIFISMDAYPDDLTYRLVTATSETVGLSPADVLKAFGEYWVLFTAQEGYGNLLKMSGSTFKEFVLNLDNMHAHVGMTFSALRPPSFRCTDVTDSSLCLHYHSSRQGLAPMVEGLLQGLGTMFNTEVHVQQSADRSAGADHDEFVVSFKPN